CAGACACRASAPRITRAMRVRPGAGALASTATAQAAASHRAVLCKKILRFEPTAGCRSTADSPVPPILSHRTRKATKWFKRWRLTPRQICHRSLLCTLAVQSSSAVKSLWLRAAALQRLDRTRILAGCPVGVTVVIDCPLPLALALARGASVEPGLLHLWVEADRPVEIGKSRVAFVEHVIGDAAIHVVSTHVRAVLNGGRERLHGLIGPVEAHH